MTKFGQADANAKAKGVAMIGPYVFVVGESEGSDGLLNMNIVKIDA